MDNGIATVKDIKDFFGSGGAIVGAKEMTDFWKTLGETDEYTYTWVNAKGVAESETFASEKDFYKITLGRILSASEGIDVTVEKLTV
jgi:hypothetical protein